MLFPMSMEFYVDTTMFLYVNNKEVFSSGGDDQVIIVTDKGHIEHKQIVVSGVSLGGASVKPS